MKKKTLDIGVADIVLAVLCAVLLVGMLTFLRPCGPKEDGSWMTCHWAGQALTGAAGALFVLSAVRLFVSAPVKQGLDIAAAVLSVLAICIPGSLIDLCMMADMHCRAVMRPGVTVLAILIILTAAADLFLHRKKDKT